MIKQKPGTGNNDWLGNTVTTATLQIIGDDDKWQTVGECIDTPNTLTKELANKKYKGMDIWIRDGFGGHKYHGHVK